MEGSWENVTDAEILLRRFDLDIKYGPRGGITRLERLICAEKSGLTPPSHLHEILNAVIDTEPNGENSEAEKDKRIKAAFGVSLFPLHYSPIAYSLAIEGRQAP